MTHVDAYTRQLTSLLLANGISDRCNDEEDDPENRDDAHDIRPQDAVSGHHAVNGIDRESNWNSHEQ